METSREHPSERYLKLIAMNKEMHLQGAAYVDFKPRQVPEKTFAGDSVKPHIQEIKKYIQETGAKTLLDYGCGKALLYHSPIQVKDKEYPSLQEYWGVKVTLYDPAYPPYEALPKGKWDAVICIDVLEHCAEEDLPWIVEELFSYANLFVFANVACFSALKLLPNNENAHVTVRPFKWWKSLVKPIAAAFPEIRYQFICTENHEVGGQPMGIEKVLQNFHKA